MARFAERMADHGTRPVSAERSGLVRAHKRVADDDANKCTL